MGLSPLDGAPLAGEGGWVLWCWGDPAHPDCLARCRDGLPYCEADYHAKFGIRCDGCEKYITGHVLEVGAAPVGAGFHLPREGRQGPQGDRQSCVLVQESVPRAFATVSSHLCQGTPGSAYTSSRKPSQWSRAPCMDRAGEVGRAQGPRCSPWDPGGVSEAWRM